MCFALKPQLIDLSQRKTYLSGVFFVNDAAISAGLISTILSKVVVFFVEVKEFVKKHNVFIIELVLLVLLLLRHLHLVLQQLPYLKVLLHLGHLHLQTCLQELHLCHVVDSEHQLVL
jgi:hypothetical protein